VSARLLRLAVLGLVVVSLAACGKRGAPMAPKDEPNVYPRAYPSDQSAPVTPSNLENFPTIREPNTNLDPTQPRTLGQPGSTE